MKSRFLGNALDEKCPEHLVNDLVQFGFNQQAVERWSGERARATLDKYRRDTKAAMARADGAARRADGVHHPPPQPLRDHACEWIGRALGRTDRDDLLAAVENGVGHLAGDELLRLASDLIRRLRIPPALPQSTPPPVLPVAPAKPTDHHAAPAAVDRSVEL